MTSHELAKKLLDGPDLPVTIPVGVHSSFEVSEDVTDAYEVEVDKSGKKKLYTDDDYPNDHIQLSYR